MYCQSCSACKCLKHECNALGVVKRTVYIITSHLLYSTASYVADVAVKPAYEKESEVKDLCYLTQQFLQEFLWFQAVQFHFR